MVEFQLVIIGNLLFVWRTTELMFLIRRLLCCTTVLYSIKFKYSNSGIVYCVTHVGRPIPMQVQGLLLEKKYSRTVTLDIAG